jgi:hypothetical protein
MVGSRRKCPLKTVERAISRPRRVYAVLHCIRGEAAIGELGVIAPLDRISGVSGPLTGNT